MWWVIAGIIAYYFYQKQKEDQMKVTYIDQSGKVTSIDSVRNVVVDEVNVPPPIPPLPPLPPSPPPVPPPIPSGSGDGTRNNPFKMTRYESRGLGYTVQFSDTADMDIPGNTKLYFEVDPPLVGLNPIIFMMNVKTYGAPITFSRAILFKATGEITPDVPIYTSTLGDNVWNRAPNTFDKVKYIYGIENLEPTATIISVFWSI